MIKPMTTEFQHTAEELQYSVDVLQEYIYEFSNKKDGNRVFQLGKIEAALEEFKIRYNCFYDIVMEQEKEKKKEVNVAVPNSYVTGLLNNTGSAANKNDLMSKTVSGGLCYETEPISFR